MKPCIYGNQSYPEGAKICVNGRALKCALGEWHETGVACTEADGLDVSDQSVAKEGKAEGELEER